MILSIDSLVFSMRSIFNGVIGILYVHLRAYTTQFLSLFFGNADFVSFLLNFFPLFYVRMHYTLGKDEKKVLVKAGEGNLLAWNLLMNKFVREVHGLLRTAINQKTSERRNLLEVMRFTFQNKDSTVYS